MVERFNNAVAKWPSGLLGFMVCAVFSVLVCVWFYLTAGERAEHYAELGVADTGYARRGAIYLGQLLMTAFAAHWGIAAVFGKGRVDGLALPNVLLALATVAWLAIVTVHFYGWTDTYCDQLPFSHEGFDITRILECPSNATFFNGLQMLSIILYLTSLALRIVLSRRKDARTS